LNRRIFIFFVLAILFLQLISADVFSNVQSSMFTKEETKAFDNALCQEGKDFLVQIAPFGCEPAVVRTDLLEENDVQVHCKLGATQINPLIEVETIDSISFTGNYPESVSGIGFHPAKAALGVKGDLNSPVLNNIGYLVINLKKQSNASAIPDSVEGTLTARIKYNIKNALGIGSASLYLQELTQEDWADKRAQYNFWNGKGTLKADAIGSDSAQISIYSNEQRISSVNLNRGETSNMIYIPGLQCQAGLKLKLDSLENPNTRALLRINAEVFEVAACGGSLFSSSCEKFLDNKCTVISLESRGINQKARIKCIEDEKTSEFSLIISPKLILSINGAENEYSVGDYLYSEGSKRVYLAYIGNERNKNDINSLFAFFVSKPSTADKLSEEEITSLDSLISDMTYNGISSSGIIDSTNDALKSFAGLIVAFGRSVNSGENLYTLRFADGEKTAFGQNVAIKNFVGSQNLELTGTAKEYYENAKEAYETIRNSYTSEPYKQDSSSTFGEEAFYNEILLAWRSNQRKTSYDLCQEFMQAYPNSNKDLSYCTDAIKNANEEIQEVYVTVNGEVKTISFDGIVEPTFDDYGVRIVMSTPDGINYFDLTKGKIVYTNENNADYLQLVSADDDSAEIRTSFSVEGLTASIAKEFNTGIIKLQKDTPKSFTGGYSFTLTRINLKKTARVSVIPNINNAGTEANFSFKIGIEKRAISLPPEKTREIITNLNKTITQWSGISNTLGTTVQGLQAGCLAAGTALVAKNFLTGTGGAGIARQTVMRGSDGWTEKCTDLVAQKTYESLDKCYLENSDKIDKDVEEVSKIIEQQNARIKQLESGITKTEFLTDSIVNTSAFMQRYIPEVSECLGNQGYADPSEKGTEITFADLNSISYINWEDNKYFSKEDLRDIELYCDILKSNTASNDLKEIARQRIYSNLLDVKKNAGNKVVITNLANTFGIASDDITFVETGENVRKFRYEGLTNGNTGNRISGEGITSDTPVAVVSTSDGKQYIVALDNSVGTQQLPIKKVYTSTGAPVDTPPEFTRIYFQRYDASSYQNQYKNAQLRYYETEPYKGLPAMVPFDLKNGWYAATKQTLPTGGNIQPFDASARPNSFYLCNVGENGLEEFQTIGDDTCEMINLGTGMPYSQFPGLDEREAKTLIDKGVQAITQASRLYRAGLSGKVNILGEVVEVGSPAADIPQFQCQDFMSPKECLLLFNLCDPVICPSSRCDLGGAYPVKDVVQSGVIGSLVLCLPNMQEGIIFPVCLTGVKAGLDGFLSILNSYKDCLQESLDTGKVVGICDEIYSIYVCDFFWRQALPFTDIVIPKVVEALLGQNVRGGGEYAGVESSWSLAEQSVSYFINYYGVNAKNAFLTRTTETIQSEVCKSYVSAVVPTGADFVNKITQPASPVQFTGRFDEIPLTTATVPPTSHYKVFYHIFAGKDSGAYYQVYLKGSPETSYYQDASQNLIIASGYVAVGGYATDTPDLTAVSGYNQMCINVNGQEVCGFKEVSTDFAINYVKDNYLAEQATTTDITTESECISGSASIYNLLTPNAQAGVEGAINPAIYDRGITRICATENPGLGTDVNVYTATPVTGGVITGKVGFIDEEIPPTTDTTEEDTPTTTIEEDKKIIENLTSNPGVVEGPRWVAVGYCDNEKIKCWLDTESVKDVIKGTTIEGDALDEVTQNYMEVLLNEGNYLSEKDFSSAIQEIEIEKDNSKKLNLISNIFGNVFWSTEKVQLIFLRGNAYAELLAVVLKEQPKPDQTITGVKETEGVKEKYLNLDARDRALAAAADLDGTIVPGRNLRTSTGLGTVPINKNCLSAAYSVYEAAGVSYSCVYSNPYADKFAVKTSAAMENTLIRNDITNLQTYNAAKSSAETRTIILDTDRRPDKTHATWITNERCKGVTEEQKLNSLQPGDFILYVWSATWPSYNNYQSLSYDYDHAAIFIRWADEKNRIAVLFDWNGASSGNSWGIKMGEQDKNGKLCTDENRYYNRDKNPTPFCAIYRYYEVDLNDDAHPVYLFQVPYVAGQSVPGNKKGIDAITTDSDSADASKISEITNPTYPISYKIFSESIKFVGTSGTPLAFVTQSLSNAKAVIKSFPTINDLTSTLSADKNFVEVDVNNLQKGDVILLGKGCDLDSVGIFSEYRSDKKEITYYTSVDGKVQEVKSSFVTKIDFNLFIYKYVYRAYRYVGDLTDTEKKTVVKARIRWTLSSALERFISAGAPTRDYDKNKIFSDELAFDGILTKQECQDLTGGILGFGKDMNWLKTKLLEKQSTSGVSGLAH